MYQNKGFTLIELLVVVLIIGILSSVALPQYEKAVEKSRGAEGIMLSRAIFQAQQAYYMANGQYTHDLNDLDLNIPGESISASGVSTQRTKNFDCRAVGAGSSGADFSNLAVCRRIGKSYAIAFPAATLKHTCIPNPGSEQGKTVKYLPEKQRRRMNFKKSPVFKTGDFLCCVPSCVENS